MKNIIKGEKRICPDCGLVNSDGDYRANCAECAEDLPAYVHHLEGRLRARGILGLSEYDVNQLRHKIESLKEVAATLAAGRDVIAPPYTPSPELCGSCCETISEFNRQHAGKFSAKIVTVAA